MQFPTFLKKIPNFKNEPLMTNVGRAHPIYVNKNKHMIYRKGDLKTHFWRDVALPSVTGNFVGCKDCKMPNNLWLWCNLCLLGMGQCLCTSCEQKPHHPVAIAKGRFCPPLLQETQLCMRTAHWRELLPENGHTRSRKYIALFWMGKSTHTHICVLLVKFRSITYI